MKKILLTARRFQAICEEQQWPFCLIGGVAIQRWGELRLTKDVDATIYTGYGNEPPVIDRLLKDFEPRVDDPREFALINRVLLIQDTKRHIGVDVAMGTLDFEYRAIERATKFRFLPDVNLRTCSAEDLIVFKAFADRTLDWHDVKGILIRQQGKLDFDLIERELTPLVDLKEEPAILDKWRDLRKRYP